MISLIGQIISLITKVIELALQLSKVKGKKRK